MVSTQYMFIYSHLTYLLLFLLLYESMRDIPESYSSGIHLKLVHIFSMFDLLRRIIVCAVHTLHQSPRISRKNPSS